MRLTAGAATVVGATVGAATVGAVVLCAVVLCAAGCDSPAPSQTTPPAKLGASSAKSASAKSASAKSTGRVFFVTPQTGDIVFPEVEAAFGVQGYTLAPAGEDAPNRGHLWLLIDGDAVPKGQAMQGDGRLQLAKGERGGTFELAPGKRKLTLQLASGSGMSLGPQLAETIEIEVVQSQGARRVSFAVPKDGATVKSPVQVKFQIEGMKIRPAGQAANERTSGHHHLFIDSGPVPVGAFIPRDAKHIHYAGGETEVEIELPKGKHTLTAQFGDGAHMSFGPSLAATITVTVQ